MFHDCLIKQNRLKMGALRFDRRVEELSETRTGRHVLHTSVASRLTAIERS